MDQLPTLVINGLSIGAVYALIALGIVIIYKASGVVTFMHGSLVLLGAYITARFNAEMSFYLAAAGGILCAALAALVVERLIIRRLEGAPVISLAIATIGVELILLTILVEQIGSDVLNVNHPWGGGTVSIAGTGVSQNRAISLVAAIVLMAAFFTVFRYTSWGIAMRAASEDGETASLMGIRLGRVSAITWLVSGGLAAVAGIFLVGSPTPGVTPGLAALALSAFPAAILGGLDSVAGALVGGLTIGVMESLAAGYEEHIEFLGHGFGDMVPFVVMIAVLLVRPSGLFGMKEMTRV